MYIYTHIYVCLSVCMYVQLGHQVGEHPFGLIRSSSGRSRVRQQQRGNHETSHGTHGAQELWARYEALKAEGSGKVQCYCCGRDNGDDG